MIVSQGQVYLERGHIELLQREPGYVVERYAAAVRALAPQPFGITRQAAADMLRVSLRHFYRVLKRFKELGIAGLRKLSRRPKTTPRRTPAELEEKVLAVRQATGFGSRRVASIINESIRREGSARQLAPSVAYDILVRGGEIEREKAEFKRWRRFEWGRPNQLLQADLTEFNGTAILTVLDDHSRRAWALALRGRGGETVMDGFRHLLPFRFENLLTDNGCQFSRSNTQMQRFCLERVTKKHIWTSIHHPQTMGKLSAYQKGLKRFLVHKVPDSQDPVEINVQISVYNDFYNNGRFNAGTGGVPEERYSGTPDRHWYGRLVKALKLERYLAT